MLPSGRRSNPSWKWEAWRKECPWRGAGISGQQSPSIAWLAVRDADRLSHTLRAHSPGRWMWGGGAETGQVLRTCALAQIGKKGHLFFFAHNFYVVSSIFKGVASPVQESFPK